MAQQFFEELSRCLRKEQIESYNKEDRRLEIFLHGQPVLSVSPGNEVFLLPAGSKNPEANELYHRVAIAADSAFEYVEAMENTPLLRARGLENKFHLLADFGGAVLAGRERAAGQGYEFVTWIWDYEKVGVSHGHYYSIENCEGETSRRCSMPYIHFTDEQKLRANSVDLVEFLRRQGEKLIPSGRDKRLASDHSITVRGNEWYDHEAEEGGGPISFVQTFYGLSYPEAVTRLLGGEKGEVYQPAQKKEQEEPKEFALPPANQTMRRVYAYLLQQRHISREILNTFAQKGLIYESRELSKDKTKEYHNAVFVGTDEHGVARHAHKRGIYTQGKSYRGNVEGCDPRHSFHWTGSSERLYVFEAPIDLLAFLTLYPEDWQRHSYVALCGTAEHAMLWMLEQNPKLQKIILCLDHDAAGIEAAGRLTDILREHGYTQAAPLRSINKDWDEDLKEQHGLEAQPPEEHPQLILLIHSIAYDAQNVSN